MFPDEGMTKRKLQLDFVKVASAAIPAHPGGFGH
jgi:hypothetical protein